MMKLVPGKLYEVIQEIEMIGYCDHGKEDEACVVTKSTGSVMMFIRQQPPPESEMINRGLENVFLNQGRLFIASEYEVDDFPEDYFRETEVL